MFKAQQRIRFAVTVLLPQKSPKRKTPIVPHDRGRTEGNDPSSLLNSPAKIDVITCFAVFGVKAAHALKRPPIKRHVATRNMLGDHIGKQYMARSTGCRCNASLNPTFGWRRDIRPTHSSVITAYKSADEIIQPIGINHAVRIGVGEDFTFSCGGTSIPSMA